ncbi:MAG TPA: bifunctional oligoribonuclease/PAP phosphatase NrnA [Aquaticitalea sp.]|nr:bifunctional oligoribonuclease/PAP phosphatase NrnA [Aquaticitalea sp.]HNU60007.1 bifunctional oligoribonuclease/PAP phosphatase NrnA [Aquaticitalea sp.]
MTEREITDIGILLSEPKAIVIVPHKNPDGDAVGSCLGLYIYLCQLGHDAIVIAPNDYPDFLKWLPFEKNVIKYDSQEKIADTYINNAEVIFTLDFNALQRTGDMESVLKASRAVKIMIDHHQQPDGYASFTYSDVRMSSTCEMVFNFIEMLGGSKYLNPEIATCLYTGIMTDTGSFRYPSTSGKTHRIIAELIDKGANNAAIHNAVYDTNSFERLQLLGRALKNLVVLPEYRTAYITLSQEDLNEFQHKKGDTEGFVNYGLSIENIVFAVIFIEQIQEGITKISFRSKGDFSVNEFARTHFEGGGHINAAGGKTDLDLSETLKKFIAILPQYKKALNS